MHDAVIHSQGIHPPPEITVVPLDTVASTFDTGDIILLSGATNSGAIIKLFDDSQFSHVGIVSHLKIIKIAACYAFSL